MGHQQKRFECCNLLTVEGRQILPAHSGEHVGGRRVMTGQPTKTASLAGHEVCSALPKICFRAPLNRRNRFSKRRTRASSRSGPTIYSRVVRGVYFADAISPAINSAVYGLASIYKHLRILGAASVFSGQRLCHRKSPTGYVFACERASCSR